MSFPFPHTEQRLNAIRYADADPAAKVAAAAIVVALADARQGSPAQRAEALSWLADDAGREWVVLLGGDDVLADALEDGAA